MKKNFSLTLLTLFLMFFSFVIFPIKVFANSTFVGMADDWFNHISQFDNGFARCEIYQDFDNEKFGLLIVEEHTHEFDGLIFEYDYDFWSDDWEYFESELASHIKNHYAPMFADVVPLLEAIYEDDFDGYLYWNFEEEYWQVEIYWNELDYYKQRVDELEDEIRQLEEALDLEYDRGYNEGYEIGYNEGLLVENNNDITKWFVPLVVIIIIVGIIEPIILIKRRG